MRLEALSATAFDLLVVGGGINGAGIAREAARRGLRVALVEKQDYGAGTTSRSTRLIHGGLRYLEHGELMLVLESLREREHLLRRTPHLVRPLRFVIPVHQNSSRGALMIRAGMVLYDLLSAGKGLPNHFRAGPKELRDLERQIHAPGLKGAFIFYDGQINFPERLVMETIADARAHGAVALNHCDVVGFRMDGRRVRGAVVSDSLTGAQVEVTAELTLNATGPWLEQLDRLLPVARPRPLLAPTRGSHLAVAKFPGAPEDALYFEARADHRPMFVIPWQGLYLVGTTDLPFSGDPSVVRPGPDEVSYLLDEANAAIPEARLTRDSILFTYAGVRALPFEDSTEPGALTRRHILLDHQECDGIAGIATVVGGKLTTFRSLARDVVDKLLRKMGRATTAARNGNQPAPHEAPQFAVMPWRASREELLKTAEPEAARHGLAPAQVVRLCEMYGDSVVRILALLDGDPRLRCPLSSDSPVLAAEVVYAARHEQALTLGDVLLRRTCAALSPGRGSSAVPEAAALLAGELQWSSQRRDAALDEWADEVERTIPR